MPDVLLMSGAYLQVDGDRLRSARKQAGLSQERLAQLADVSQPMLSRLEAGDSRTRRGNVLRIAKAVQVEPEVLVRLRAGAR